MFLVNNAFTIGIEFLVVNLVIKINQGLQTGHDNPLRKSWHEFKSVARKF
jgi:hypothetical protein